jgi:hypothetical protein
MESPEFAQGIVRGNNGHVMPVSHGGDENLIVSFYSQPVKLGAESDKAGRPIYQDVPYVWIRFPGDRTREVKRKATDEHKARFPRQWAAFERQQEYVEQGTPLEDIPWMSRSRALTLKGANIHTMENYAAVTDDRLHALGHGAREERDKCRTQMKLAADSAEALRLQGENQALKDDIALLKEQVAELAKKRGKKDEG